MRKLTNSASVWYGPNRMSTEKPTLVVGDTHGHIDRLAALLRQEGITNDKGDRIDFETRVIHIGDIIDGRMSTVGRDRSILEAATDRQWIDDLIWGNHERGLFDPNRHGFKGMLISPETKILLNRLERRGQTHYALAVHDFLLTHAGLGAYWDSQVPDELEDVVTILNGLDGYNAGVLHAVSYLRQGSHPAGGIIWRDDSEPISGKFNQVYGHTADPDALHRLHETDGKVAYKIDIGKKHPALGGIWLPSHKLVKIDLSVS